MIVPFGTGSNDREAHLGMVAVSCSAPAGAVLSHLQLSAGAAVESFEPWNSEIAIS